MIQLIEILIDCLYFHSKNGNDDPARDSFDTYYMPIVEVKDITVINRKAFFDQSVRNKQEAYKELIEMSRIHDYTTGNLLDFLYLQNYYKLTGLDLSRQTNTTIPQKINFTGKLEEDDGAIMFLALKSSKKLF